jgi:hypothetical protein
LEKHAKTYKILLPATGRCGGVILFYLGFVLASAKCFFTIQTMKTGEKMFPAGMIAKVTE